MKKNEIKIFNSEEFGEVRVIGSPENPLFCLADLCRVLDLIPSKVAQRLEKGVLSKYPLSTNGGIQELNFVNEDGLYDVILDSRKPEARKFRKWVTGEVLPSIRKTGGYVSDVALDRVKTKLLATEETLEDIPLYTLGDLRMDVGMDEGSLRAILVGVYMIENVKGRYELCKGWGWDKGGLATHRNKLVRKRGKDKLESELVFTDRGRLVVRVIVERMRDLYAELDDMTAGFERGEFPSVPMPREEKFVRKMREKEEEEKKLVVVNNN